MKKIKLFPLVMTILSALYFIVTAVSEDYKYQVDTVGGDPGGKVLPLMMGAFFSWVSYSLQLKKDQMERKWIKELSFSLS